MRIWHRWVFIILSYNFKCFYVFKICACIIFLNVLNIRVAFRQLHILLDLGKRSSSRVTKRAGKNPAYQSRGVGWVKGIVYTFTNVVQQIKVFCLGKRFVSRKLTEYKRSVTELTSLRKFLKLRRAISPSCKVILLGRRDCLTGQAAWKSESSRAAAFVSFHPSYGGFSGMQLPSTHPYFCK